MAFDQGQQVRVFDQGFAANFDNGHAAHTAPEADRSHGTVEDVGNFLKGVEPKGCCIGLGGLAAFDHGGPLVGQMSWFVWRLGDSSVWRCGFWCLSKVGRGI